MGYIIEGEIDMYTVKIMNEFLHGAIWVYEDGVVSSLPTVDEDQILQELNRKTMELFNSYFEFDSNGESCTFNNDLSKKTKGEMLELISQIKERLNQINHGEFVVEDYETDRLKNL